MILTPRHPAATRPFEVLPRSYKLIYTPTTGAAFSAAALLCGFSPSILVHLTNWPRELLLFDHTWHATSFA
jgi:hypothetical protein